jgi:hydroxyacylglutathione hydrolase
VLVEGFPAQLADTNCWVVAPAAGEQCVIVDPGVGVGPQLDAVIAEHRLHPVAVLLTHGHLDHTFSVFPVCSARDVPAYIHGADRSAVADPWTSMGLPYGAPIFGVAGLTFAEPDDVRELDDGAVLDLAGLTLRVEHAPGHTEGSVVFCTAGADADAPGVMFSGDVLFAGSIGRMDLRGGSEQAMARSLERVILRPRPVHHHRP